MKRTLLNTAPASAIPFDFSHTTKEASIHRAAKFVLPLASIALTLGLLPSSPISAQARSLSQPTQQRTEANSSAQDGKDVRSLEPDKPIERELAGGEAHSYRIMLNRGEYLHVAVDQRGIDVVVALRGPDGAQLMEMDGLSGMLGMEEVSWEAASAGGYVLEVRAKAKAANAGRYEVRVEKAAAATARERARITAEQLYMEGIRAQGEGRGEALEKAIKKYGEAVEKWRGAGERKWEAQTLLNLGVIYANLSQHEKARDYYEQALAISREIKDRRGEGLTLNNLGIVYANLSQHERAREHFEQALAISREIKDREGEGGRLGNLGVVYENLSQHEKARDYYEQALAISREIKDREGEGITLLNLGVIYANLSQHEKARDYYEQALAISREIKDREGEGITLGNLGNVYENLSQYEKARDYYEQALAISREIKDRRGVAETLGNLGNVYANLSQHEKARDYYEQALAIRREIKDRRGVAETLGNLGVIYANLSQEYEKARDYYEQALAIRRETKDRRGEGQTLNNLGNVYESLSQHEKARDYYEQALAIRRETKDRRGEGQTLKNLGNVYESLSQHERAREHFEQALAISREIKDSGGEASTLLSVASLERDRGNLSEARKQIESALAIVENLRATYTNQELRAAYFASVQDYYEFYIDLLMRLHKQDPAAGHEAAALQASERARARALLDLLAEAGADIRQGVDPQLVERERSLQRQLNIKAQQQTKLLSGQQTTEQAAAIAREIESLTNEYQQLQAQIRQSSPRYAALTQPVPLSLKEIQAQLLDADTLLLEYSLGQERSYLWAVTPASITSYELPKQAEIEEVARQVYAQMAKAGQVARTDASGQRGIGDALSQSPHVAAATRLSQMLLSPVSAQLGKKRLLIVSDGALQFIPFAALPIPTVGKTIAYQPLIAKHEIVSLPSASTLAVLRRETGRRAPAPKAVAVLADPVFEKTDERLKMSAAQPEGGNGARAVGADTDRGLGLEVTKAAEESGVASVGLRIPRLPGTKREAEQILKLVPATERKAAFDFAASHATATSPELSQYRYVHFATHGFLNSQHPELSGIMLSMFDERGQPQDGFLRAHEVFNLKLPAELVVLSACQTGLGKEVRGEGLVGLTRGFMYAGAPRVVVSLWSVSDAATAELMTRFYRKMLQDKMRPAAALRSAQVSLMKEKKWNAPFYWAAFTLQGEWR